MSRSRRKTPIIGYTTCRSEKQEWMRGKNIIAPFGGLIVDRVGVKWPAFLGSLVLALGLVGFSQLTVNSSYGLIYLCLIVTGLGMGIAFSALNSGMVKTINAEDSIFSSI